jgi:predicted RNA methylase
LRGAPAAERPYWLFLTEPGIADLALKELKARKVVGQKTRATKLFVRNYELLVIPDSQIAAPPKDLRLTLHALAAPVFGRRKITDGQLMRLAGAWARERADHLVSSVAGEAFGRQDLMRWLGKQLLSLGVETKAGEKRPCWLIVVDDAYYFGFPRFNHHEANRRDRPEDRSGALPPTIAAALVFAAKPGPGEVIWDPVCGSGTLLREAKALAPDAALIGTDKDERAIELAKTLVPGAHLKVADAGSVDPGRDDVTLTLANLPWGVQYESEGGNTLFYEAVLRNALASAAEAWRGVFITSDGPAMRAAVREVGGLSVRQVASPKVRGRDAGIWMVERG